MLGFERKELLTGLNVKNLRVGQSISSKMVTVHVQSKLNRGSSCSS